MTATFSGAQSWSNPEYVKYMMMNMTPAHARPEKFLTVEEISEVADDFRKALFDKWDSLGSIMAIHENSIRKRWSRVCALCFIPELSANRTGRGHKQNGVRC